MTLAAITQSMAYLSFVTILDVFVFPLFIGLD